MEPYPLLESPCFFESTGNFLISVIPTVIPFAQKKPGKSRALRDKLAIL